MDWTFSVTRNEERGKNDGERNERVRLLLRLEKSEKRKGEYKGKRKIEERKGKICKERMKEEGWKRKC